MPTKLRAPTTPDILSPMAGFVLLEMILDDDENEHTRAFGPFTTEAEAWAWWDQYVDGTVAAWTLVELTDTATA